MEVHGRKSLHWAAILDFASVNWLSIETWRPCWRDWVQCECSINNLFYCFSRSFWLHLDSVIPPGIFRDLTLDASHVWFGYLFSVCLREELFKTSSATLRAIFSFKWGSQMFADWCGCGLPDCLLSHLAYDFMTHVVLIRPMFCFCGCFLRSPVLVLRKAVITLHPPTFLFECRGIKGRDLH